MREVIGDAAGFLYTLTTGESEGGFPMGLESIWAHRIVHKTVTAGAMVAFLMSASTVLAQSNTATAGDGAAPAVLEPASPIASSLQAALGPDVPDSLMQHYTARAFAPVWVADNSLTENAHLAIAAMAASNDHALNPANYRPLELAGQAERAQTPDDWARFDLDMSTEFVRYATHLSSGRVQPNEVNKALNVFPDRPEPAALLSAATGSDDFATFLAELPPQSDNYARLKRRLAQYRQKAATGGFTSVPDGEVLKPGMRDARVPFLRKRLMEEDIPGADGHSGQVYDGALIEAVKTFQEYHGLATDGVIGPNTFARLNISIEQKLIQMELNMERRRWMRDDLGDFYIFVNLADQNLKVVKNGKTIHTARVVVGKPFHATPVFSDTLEYVEVNPYWNVPYSIATREYLPDLQQNPSALSSKNIRVFQNGSEVAATQVGWNAYSRQNFPFRLRQDPGPSNALGRIKFMFPNEFNIYIHDTPSKSLFSQAERAFSHGCIRVSDPFALADVILADHNLPDGVWKRYLESGERDVFSKFSQPVEVHLTYLTAWMNKDGSTHFRHDIYDRDKVLLDALRTAMTDNL
ncbi:L,D-transpeptidase family protein [Roseibium denhamense]